MTSQATIGGAIVDGNSNIFNFAVDGVDRFNLTPGGSFRVVRQDASNSGLNVFLRKRGQVGNELGAIANDATMGAWQFSGWDGAAFQNGVSVIARATEAWSGSVRGTYLDFQTTVTGTANLVSGIKIQGDRLGFFGVTPALRPSVSLGSSVDTVITALKSLGLFS